LINEKYKRILESLKFTYTEFTIEGIENDKIVILLNQNKIMMSDSNVEFMRESYPQNFIEFIRLNIGKYVEDVASDVPLEYDEILEMILTDISDEHKIAFINMTDNSISIRDRALSPVVQKYILENNYDENDMPYLVEDFETLHPIIQDVFEKICAERINVLIENNYVLPFALLRELLRYRFDLRMKQKLLAGSFDPLSIEQAVEILSLAGLSKLIRAFKGGRPGLPRTEDVRRILHICERNKWISSVSETGNYYIANGWQKEPPLKA